MSIIGEVTNAAAQQREELRGLVFFVVLSLLAAALAWWIGVFRRRSVVGPSRVGDHESMGPIVLILATGFIFWFFGQLFFALMFFANPSNAAAASATTSPATHPTVAPASMLNLTPLQLAIVASVPTIIAFIVMLAGNALVRRRGLAQLGLSSSQFLPGVLKGLLGSLIAVPFTFLASQLTEFLWQWIHFEHPQEHDLLRVIGESQSHSITALLIASAVLFAPLFEELLFRGHLQTLLTHGFSRLGQRRSRSVIQSGFDIILPGGETGYVALPPAPSPLNPPSATIRWISIFITSLLFGLVHSLWMTPPIFVLALCLGYAYERTGNLWTTITMHATFNTISTLLFIFLMH